MNIDAGVVKYPRRLVVEFGYDDGAMIGTDDGDRPQLVHYQGDIKRPSRLIRFATRLGLTKEDKPMMDAVEKAYAFVAANYRQGDQVTLVVSSYYDRHLDAAEMLAKHLHDGTRPGDQSRFQSKNVGDVPPGRIPIHCVAALGIFIIRSSDGRKTQSQTCVTLGLGEWTSVSERSDELKSRFPAGIEHIICWDYLDGTRTCATRYDADGSMISREIFISGDNYASRLWRHCTKHVIYYKEDWIPKWDDHKPVWTHQLESSPSDDQGGLPLEATRPFGMYVYELRNYQGLPGLQGDDFMLVWKSYRSAGEDA